MSNHVHPSIASDDTTSHQLIPRGNTLTEVSGSLISTSLLRPPPPPGPLFPTTLSVLSAPPPLAVSDDDALDPHLFLLYRDMRERLIKLLVLDDDATTALARLRREVQALRAELDGLAPERAAQVVALAAVTAAADHWERVARDADAAKGRAEERTRMAEDGLRALREELRERLDHDARMHRQAMAAQEAGYERELAELRDGVAKSQTQLHESRAEVRREGEQLRIDQEKLRRAQRDAGQRGSESASNEAAVAALKRSLNSSQQRLAQTERELAVVRGQLEVASGGKDRPAQEAPQPAKPAKRPAEPHQRQERGKSTRRRDDDNDHHHDQRNSDNEEYGTRRSSKRR